MIVFMNMNIVVMMIIDCVFLFSFSYQNQLVTKKYFIKKTHTFTSYVKFVFLFLYIKIICLRKNILFKKIHKIHQLCKVLLILSLFYSCLKNIIMHWNAKKSFQILPFHNNFIERPKIKK